MSTVEVENLRVELDGTHIDVVDDISFRVDAGEVLGLVGESGSGKTTVSVALLGHARKGARIVRGSIRIDGTDILALGKRELSKVRGQLVSYVPQDPAASLNPGLRIGTQLRELIEVHEPGVDGAQISDRIRATLDEVKLPSDEDLLRRFPHQLSGGQMQRVCIAMAFLLRPRVIVLDEPTTGLDVTTQEHVLATVSELCRSHRVAALYVTHDLAVVANLATRVLVMYAGRLAEMGPREAIFNRPAHPYTRRLTRAVPDVTRRRSLDKIPGKPPPPGARPAGCFFHPRCSWRLDDCTHGKVDTVTVAEGHVARCLRAHEIEALPMEPPTEYGDAITRGQQPDVLAVEYLNAFYGRKQVLFDVSLEITRGECAAVVGESGSGKTTLARAIAGLHTNYTGYIRLNDESLERQARGRSRETRRSIQYIFQSPYNSLNPRRSVDDIVAVPLRQFYDLTATAQAQRIAAALERVSLPATFGSKYPDELSGGERQRVAIARALVSKPDVLICDEVTSSLDVSVQAVIIDLLQQLQREEELALLFVTHNLALVRSIADRVIVMHDGRIVEVGEVEAVIDSPRANYTRDLVARTPSIAHVGKLN